MLLVGQSESVIQSVSQLPVITDTSMVAK